MQATQMDEIVLKFCMQCLRMVPQKIGAGISDDMIFYPTSKPLQSKNDISGIFFNIFGIFGSPKWLKNENQEQCRTTLEKSIKSKYNKNEVFSTNTKGPAIFKSGYPGGANMVGVRKCFDDF